MSKKVALSAPWINPGAPIAKLVMSPMRKVEIGPGRKKLRGFESLDAVGRAGVDYAGDARSLPFPDGSFGLLYASHVIEHLPWYETVDVLKEWHRVLVPGGSLEVWTVDAIKVAKQLISYEETGAWEKPDGWARLAYWAVMGALIVTCGWCAMHMARSYGISS
jgi:ubiquinone/menaquinone biosynthesis C-methylase UbiE